MITEKYSSDNIILESGSAITYGKDSDLTLKCIMDESFSFSLVFRFESDGGNQQGFRQDISGNTITLTCINFDDPHGTGISAPFELATFNGKRVSIIFFIYALGGNTLKKVEYSIFYEK